MDNHPTPIVVTASSIDDVKGAIDNLRIVADTIATDVDGLDGQNLQDIKDNLEAVKLLIDDEDGTTVNSVMEFVAQIDTALVAGGSGLAALSGYTDDIENMMSGTEFLADGITSNPFYDVANPGVAKESSVIDGIVAIQTSVTTAKDAIMANDDANKGLIIAATTAIKTVVDTNSSTLENAGFGLAALKTLVDNVNTAVTSGETNVLNELGDATYGLAAIKTELSSRFDSVDSVLSIIDGKIDNAASKQGFRSFV